MVQSLDRTTSDQHFVYGGRTWEQFKLIQAGLAEAPGIRLFYYQGIVEILMPGLAHEIFKSIIGYLIETFLFECNLQFTATGSVTQEKIGEVSAQADESYCIGEVKSPPDLSIEVVYSSGGANKLDRYQALGVPEVWFWQDGVFSLHHLRANGYEKIQRSELPGLCDLDMALLSRCVLMAETDNRAAVRTFRQAIAP